MLETIITHALRDYEKVFNTFVRGTRFCDLFAYDEATQRTRFS